MYILENSIIKGGIVKKKEEKAPEEKKNSFCTVLLVKLYDLKKNKDFLLTFRDRGRKRKRKGWREKEIPIEEKH